MNIYNGHCLNWIIFKQYGLDTVWTVMNTVWTVMNTVWTVMDTVWTVMDTVWTVMDTVWTVMNTVWTVMDTVWTVWILLEQSEYCLNGMESVWTVVDTVCTVWIPFSSIKMIKHTWLSAYTAWVLFEQYDFYFNVINILWEEKLENYKTAWLLFFKKYGYFLNGMKNIRTERVPNQSSDKIHPRMINWLICAYLRYPGLWKTHEIAWFSIYTFRQHHAKHLIRKSVINPVNFIINSMYCTAVYSLL